MYNNKDKKHKLLVKESHMRDACGIGLIARIDAVQSHTIVQKGLEILCNLEHRGAVGADPEAGDGAGILMQIPHTLLQKELAQRDITLPAKQEYAVAQLFMPSNKETFVKMQTLIIKAIKTRGYDIIHWRDVPVNDSYLGASVKPTQPRHVQLIVNKPAYLKTQTQYERDVFILRREIKTLLEKTCTKQEMREYYVCTFSCQIIVYKGIVLGHNLEKYFLDLADEDTQSAFAIMHQRYSTNTLPSWRLAHPYRRLCHNGEINTIKGNINWMHAREKSLVSEAYGEEIKTLLPTSDHTQSDSAILDNVLEFMMIGGYNIAEAMMMLIPEPWENNPGLDNELKNFYQYNASVMEPWDGPAAIVVTDGKRICCRIDRNGLRPVRYRITKDGYLILASESGTLDVEEKNVIHSSRVKPGEVLMLDLHKKQIVPDANIKKDILSKRDYADLLRSKRVHIDTLLEDNDICVENQHYDDQQRRMLHHVYLYTQEDIKRILLPMAQNAEEPTGAMGTDTPLAIFAQKPKLLSYYFKQKFAQVTNPPIDPIRETSIMSLLSIIGKKTSLFDYENVQDTKVIEKAIELSTPIILPQEMQAILTHARTMITTNGMYCVKIDTTIKDSDDMSFEEALKDICLTAEQSVRKGAIILLLSDVGMISDKKLPIPILLCVSAIHEHLINKGLRQEVSLIVESAEPREIHHFCTLAGFGAEAIYPYGAYETISQHCHKIEPKISEHNALNNYRKALNKGILKVMSKMGISTFQSYCGAKIFDIIGLDYDFTQQWFPYTSNALGGLPLSVIERQIRNQFASVCDKKISEDDKKELDVGGEYVQRIKGEKHAWSIDTIANLQHAVRANLPTKYQDFADEMDKKNETVLNLRGLMRIKSAEELGKKPISIEDVEPVSEIVKRFSTGAMSFGSISREAHETLALAMNSIAAKSNTGEGGEETERLNSRFTSSDKCSAIKQVASGRFGVTTEYLVNAEMIQIKIAQGAKPGEGGQLPGFKIDDIIASVRYSTPGVTLISPPPHHDIYSIEDLSQLIFDLKNVNPEALISVKLVSLDGVGTVAAGVAKGYADHVIISGYEGGTGASPLSSIKHAGMPWEINLAETQQALVLNGLRDRITVQADGGFKTGRDVVIAALLGADEMAFATAPLIATGCLMMRKCHLNICPVGIATQDPELRKRFVGKPEHVINYFFFVAEEVRSYMAKMGVVKLNDLIGATEFLDTKNNITDERATHINLEPIFGKADNPFNTALYKTKMQDNQTANVLDRQLITDCAIAIETGAVVEKNYNIRNKDRSVGAMLSGRIAKKYGFKGLPQDCITLNFKGIAGQSFAAFLAHGITAHLTGETNDYLGKGLCGGRVIVRQSPEVCFEPEKSIITGNATLYGATAGEVYLAGSAGERFAVRNSGAIAVVEGVGGHCCEYMTGGVVMVLGSISQNFAAGMSGGIAYIYAQNEDIRAFCNHDMIHYETLDNTEISSHSFVDDNEDILLKENFLQYDIERIHLLLSRHYSLTHSATAKIILDDFAQHIKHFVKILPKDFKKAISVRQTKTSVMSV